MKPVAVLPVVLFSVLAIVMWKGLSGNPTLIPSVLIGKPAPKFHLGPLADLKVPGVASTDLVKGQVTLLNIWASWCVPCREEHPLLMQLAKRTDVLLVGINNKDSPTKATAFLEEMGNPFAAIGVDPNGRTTIDFGAYGVPETFLIDGKGIIRYKIIGGLTPYILNIELPAEITKAMRPLS